MYTSDVVEADCGESGQWMILEIVMLWASRQRRRTTDENGKDAAGIEEGDENGKDATGINE